MVMLDENFFKLLRVTVLLQADSRSKLMRFRNLLGGFEKLAAIDQRKSLRGAVRPDGLDRDVGGRGRPDFASTRPRSLGAEGCRRWRPECRSSWRTSLRRATIPWSTCRSD